MVKAINLTMYCPCTPNGLFSTVVEEYDGVGKHVMIFTSSLPVIMGSIG